ncbi:EAL domain-containing protein, partial [Clostridium sp. Sa3CUN1]
IILFCIFVFLTSFFTLNKFITITINKNSEEELLKSNKQSVELEKVKIETIFETKLDIFIKNVLQSGAIESNSIDEVKIIELIKYFRKENFIEIMGVIVDDDNIFLNENDERLLLDEKTIYDILSEEKSIFKYSINEEDYLVIKNSLDDYEQHNITTVYLHKDKSKNQDLQIPVYTELGYSYITDSSGNSIFYSTKDSSIIKLDNILDIIVSYSEENKELIDKIKIDMINKRSGIIKYKGSSEIKWMAYSPIGYKDLYLCTIIPESVIDANVDKIGDLSLISTIVITINIVLIFGFFKFIKRKKEDDILSLYSVTKENSYKKFNEIIDNKSILDDMNRAIINKEFRLVYQPKFDAKTKKVVGAEALIRWTRPDNTTVFPKEFIPIAEKTGFITFIDSYVFREVCEKQSEWIKKGYNVVPISLNISREKLKDQNFLYEYLKIIESIGTEKKYVQLEITEGDTYSYDNVRSNIVELIKSAGFKVLIDDFGIGYSSLSMLKNIRADYVKIDRSFIVDESDSGKDMLKHIIQIAQTFNYKIIAEGVETEGQYNFLKEYCNEIQGYYFSKPIEEQEFIDKYLK